MTQPEYIYLFSSQGAGQRVFHLLRADTFRNGPKMS